MKTRAISKKRQGGAIAVIVGISLLLLIGFLALVIDLGHLYLAKSELQNGADAAALSGAKELNGTAAGVTNAVNKAIATAGHNNYDFSKPIDITIDNIWVGSTPDSLVPASSVTSDGAASDKTFIKVDTDNRNLVAWFAPIWNIFNISTYGMAVAGRYKVDITPIGICDLSNPANTYPNELGFERGVTYRVSDANPLGPGTPFWIDPKATNPSQCDGSVPPSLPYMCAGKMAFSPKEGDVVYTNTGTSTPILEALDSRFDQYAPQAQCDPATAPPDSNIREYRCTNGDNHDHVCLRNTTTEIGLPREWMQLPYPAQQSITFVNVGLKYLPKYLSRTFADYGVLWSAGRPDGATVAQWPTLYGGTATGYQEPSPYAQTNGNFYNGNVTHTPRPGRRMINMVIVDCKTSGGNCQPATVNGIGTFFLQRQANISGDKEIYVEFIRRLQTFPPAEIRLYR